MNGSIVNDLASDQPSSGAAADPTAGLPPQVALVLRGLASGQIPGAVIDKDAPKIESGLTPDKIQSLGIGLYIPKTEGLVGVAFSPKTTSEKMLQKMDAAGTLAKNFPSMTTLLQGPSGDGLTDSAATTSDAPPEAPVGAPGDATTTVPVLPRPPFTGSAAASAATRRVNALNPEPSKRQIPGAGSVLNGLIANPA